MNENLKTGIYLGTAVVVLLVAIVTWPSREKLVQSDIIGEHLFADYQQAEDARSMQITVPDAATGRFEEFSIAQRDNLWVVPSHGNYPVDSPERLQDAALALIDLEVLDIASEDAKDHKLYGVLDPDSSGSSPAVEGMGTKVVLSDAQGKKLAELIIGEMVKDQEQNRFVRVPGRDAVYVVQVSIDPFVTRFQDWINSDLLEVAATDVKEFVVHDYLGSLERGKLEQRFLLRASAEAAPPAAPQAPPPPRTWKVEEFLEAVGGQLQESELLEGEVVDSSVVQTMLQSVERLQIADVVRKPAGMAEQLRRSEFFSDTQFGEELARYGFLPAVYGSNDDRMTYFASNGEVLIRTNSGIEYRLCFGRPLSGQEGSTASDLRRYMMVIARLDPTLITPPTLLPEPSPPVPAEPAAETPTEGEATAEATGAEGEAAEGEATESETTEAEATEDPVPPAPLVSGDDVLEGPPAGVSQEAWDQYMAELLQIRELNQNRLDEHRRAVQQAADRVLQLNQRFADWFYVISEEEYDKIHLSRTELFTAGAAGMGIDDFERMREEGLHRPDDALLDNEQELLEGGAGEPAGEAAHEHEDAAPTGM